MKPKNSKERRNSFLKFLALFLLTVGMIMLAVFFSYSVPKKENVNLRAQTKAIDAAMGFQSGFYTEMEGVKSLLDSIDEPGIDRGFQKSMINAKLVELRGTIPTKDDENHLYDMHMAIIDLYVDLQIAKDKEYELRDSEKDIDDCKAELDKVRSDLKEAKRELRFVQ